MILNPVAPDLAVVGVLLFLVLGAIVVGAQAIGSLRDRYEDRRHALPQQGPATLHVRQAPQDRQAVGEDHQLQEAAAEGASQEVNP